MSFSPPGAMNSFVATTKSFEDNEAFPAELTQAYTELAQAINFREIGLYATVESITGKSYLDPADQNLYRQSYRTVYAFGTIANGTSLTIPHGITNAFFPMVLQGMAATARPDWRPLPFVGPWATDLIALRVDATNIFVINGADGPVINNGYVVLEYVYT